MWPWQDCFQRRLVLQHTSLYPYLGLVEHLWILYYRLFLACMHCAGYKRIRLSNVRSSYYWCLHFLLDTFLHGLHGRLRSDASFPRSFYDICEHALAITQAQAEQHQHLQYQPVSHFRDFLGIQADISDLHHILLSDGLDCQRN